MQSLDTGSSVEKIMEACEEAFGAVRGQIVSCDSSNHLVEDVSQPLKPADSSGSTYRSLWAI
jgi:hypothetical protein